MPQSFDQARKQAGFTDKPYVPLSVRENSGNTGLLSKIPGSYSAEVAKTQGPPKASAAPVAGKQSVFIGLCAALNEYQQALVRQKKRAIPDQYAIEFAPPGIGAATVKRQGTQDTTTATMQTPDSAAKLDPDIQSVNRTARTWPIKAGTQIIKVIDDVMRNSSFITEQQNVEINTAVDPITGVQTQTLNPKKTNANNMQWYKISVATKDLGYDTIIRDHAYRITFIITPYPVAQMTSQYFPDSRYRGVHKAYDYWFTGNNTQILHYEQNYNNAYRIFLSGLGVDAQKIQRTDFRDQNRYIYMATSPNQSQGAKNYANEPGDNAASFLYDPTSLSQVKLRIVGDPAWLQQGEVGLGVNARTFDFSPFNADGSINFDSQAVMFSVAFNTPADYDLNTGLVNVNANNRSGKPQEYYTFQAIECKSIFSKGRFEQELQGKLVIEKNTAANQDAGRSTVANTVTPTLATNARSSPRTAEQIVAEQNAAFEYGTNEGSEQTRMLAEQDAGLFDSPAQPPTPQPASPPEPPTSTGDIDYFAGLAEPAPPNANETDEPTPSSPQIIAKDDY